MTNNLLNRYTFFITPGNILQNYYIFQNNNGFSLTDGLFEIIISKEKDINNIKETINKELVKYKKKGFEIKNKFSRSLNKNDIEKIMKIKCQLEGNLEISHIETSHYNYYIADINEYRDNTIYTERNIIFFTKELQEYIGRFTLNLSEKRITIGSIFITSSKQRQGYFTKVLKEDLKYFVPKKTKSIDVFSILKKGVGFYEKMNKEGYFEFTNKKVDGIFYLR